VTWSCVTQLGGISALAFTADPQNEQVFQNTAAAAMGEGVSSSDIVITNVSDVTVTLRGRRVSDSVVTTIDWDINYMSEQIDASAAANVSAANMQASMTTFVTGGNFTAALQSAVPALANVTVDSNDFGLTTWVIIKSSRPSSAPTGEPSGQPTLMPSGKPTGQPSGQPTGQPTSNPSCGTGSVDVQDIDGVLGTRGCNLCPPGTFTAETAGTSCHQCPMDYVSNEPGSAECAACPWPSATDDVGQKSCYGRKLAHEFSTVAGVLSAMLLLYVLCWLSAGGESIAVTVTMFVPMLDHLSDVAYVMFERFHSSGIFWSAVLFLVAPSFVFICELIGQRYYPQLWIPFTILWLESSGSGNPKHVDFDLPLTYESQESLGKVIWFFVLWAIALFAQVLTFGFTVLWCVGYVVFLLLWLFLGTLLYQSRNLAVGNISSMWYWTWNKKVFEEKPRVSKVNRGLMNRALFTGFMLETVPQLVVQIVNNTSKPNNTWSVTSLFSTAMSVYMALSGVYRFGYFRWYKGYAFEEIPIESVKIPGVDAKYTSLSTQKVSGARKMRGAQRMIKTVSTFFSEDGDAGHTKRRRAEVAEGLALGNDLDAEGLLGALSAQVALLNDERSYDHERIRQASDLIVADSLTDRKKNRMLALQEYFKILSPVDIQYVFWMWTRAASLLCT